MKAALTTITVPYGISFLSGVFYWDFPEGFYMLLGFAMLGGIAWAWTVEMKRS
jgi:hypothetical protein